MQYNNTMLLLILIHIFLRPFICALAFPYLNFVYSLSFFIILAAYLIYKKPTFTNKRTLILPLILFLFTLFVSLVFSKNKPGSLAQLYQYLSGLFLFWIAASLSSKGRLLTIQTIVLAGLVISLMAIYQYFFGFKHVLDYLVESKLSAPFILDYLRQRRVFSPFVSPSALGGYLAMIVFLVLAKKNRIWLMMSIFPPLLLTKSLGVFLSLFGALIIYFGVQGKIKKSQIFLFGGVFLLIIFMVILRSMTPKEHLQPGFSAMMRLNYWQDSLLLIKAHPFVGIGLGNFNLENSRYAHNSYLQIWVEMGILGLFSFIWMVWSVFQVGLKNLTQSISKKQTAGLLAASTVFLIHNFFDFTFFLPEVSLIWWAIFGLAIAEE